MRLAAHLAWPIFFDVGQKAISFGDIFLTLNS